MSKKKIQLNFNKKRSFISKYKEEYTFITTRYKNCLKRHLTKDEALNIIELYELIEIPSPIFRNSSTFYHTKSKQFEKIKAIIYTGNNYIQMLSTRNPGLLNEILYPVLGRRSRE